MRQSKENIRRLDTRCCACGRSLNDPKSVQLGIGPICRKNLEFGGIYMGLTTKKKSEAKRLIMMAGEACDAGDVGAVFEKAGRVESFGFTKVAEKIRARFVTVRIQRWTVEEFGWSRDKGEFSLGRMHQVFRVWTPYGSGFNEARRRHRLRGRPCREVTPHGKFHWEFKVADQSALMGALVSAFPGHAMITDKGISRIPSTWGQQALGHG